MTTKSDSKKYWWLFLGALILVIIFLFCLFKKNNSTLASLNQKPFNRYKINYHLPLHPRPLTINDTGMIQYWMTFDYLNKIFNLPTNYLQTTLGINDRRYPVITISHYSRENHLGLDILVLQIKAAIVNYLSTPKP